MKPADLLNDRTLKPKAKVIALCDLLLSKQISVNELINLAQAASDTNKATCIESLEFVTKKEPALANEKCLQFVTLNLADKAPRVKWESAKVIGNIAHLYPAKLDTTIAGLLVNTEHTGTVVRWATAFALAAILKLKTTHNKALLPALEAISNRETDNAIKKKYLDAVKKVKK